MPNYGYYHSWVSSKKAFYPFFYVYYFTDGLKNQIRGLSSAPINLYPLLTQNYKVCIFKHYIFNNRQDILCQLVETDLSV